MSDAEIEDIIRGLKESFRKVEPGEFIMARKTKVAITYSYYISDHTITCNEWNAVMGTTCGKMDNRPMVNVSWNEVKAFIHKLNQLTGHKYRLPTEAEWEFAAKGGSNGQYYYSGDNILDNVGWYKGNSKILSFKILGIGFYRTAVYPVKQLSPNKLGLYDMSGNVWELVEDYYSKDFPHGKKAVNICVWIKNIFNRDNPHLYQPLPDYKGPIHGKFRVAKGGSYKDNDIYCMSTSRMGYNSEYRGRNLGFRLAVDELQS